jgi:hypothetical protein
MWEWGHAQYSLLLVWESKAVDDPNKEYTEIAFESPSLNNPDVAVIISLVSVWFFD